MLHSICKSQKMLWLVGLFVIAPMTQQVHAETCRVVGIASNDVLNMRQSASTKSPILDMLAPQQKGIKSSLCKKVGKAQWCYVTNPKTQMKGWASKNFLKCHKLGLTAEDYSYSVCNVTRIPSNDVLNIRQGASTKTPIVGMLAPKQKNVSTFECKKVAGKSIWCYVVHPISEAEGWVSAKYLTCY